MKRHACTIDEASYLPYAVITKTVTIDNCIEHLTSDISRYKQKFIKRSEIFTGDSSFKQAKTIAEKVASCECSKEMRSEMQAIYSRCCEAHHDSSAKSVTSYY